MEKLVPNATFKADPQLRRPKQATLEEVQALPTHATLLMADGRKIELELMVDQAPMSVARFVKLARAGYYDGLTFHRIVPNFVIQGGSPDANEYSGDDRFMRDELGRVPHLRGSVGISTRGRDTGDAQIFIDLLDLPRLDHDYTVFAMVTTGMDVVDHILEGAVIVKIVV
jgi:cyclophilin family peptidyl-prolyl cis-trans isomerase